MSLVGFLVAGGLSLLHKEGLAIAVIKAFAAFLVLRLVMGWVLSVFTSVQGEKSISWERPTDNSKQ